MVYYECFRCGYNTKHRGNFQHHLNRKNICNPIHEDVSIEHVKEYYDFENENKITPNNSISLQNHSKLLQNDSNYITPNNSISLQNNLKSLQNNSISLHLEENKAICEYCLRTYKRKDNLTKHLKICKKKKEVEILVVNQNEEIVKMKKEIEKLKKYKGSNNTTNNNNITNNINNTININNYGDEDLSYLKSKDFLHLFGGIYGAIPKLIEKIHFDPKHPENQNIKYTNKKLPYLKIRKENKWQLVSKKDELLDLIDNKCFMLKEKYYKILEKKKYNINNFQKSKIEEFMKKYHEEDKKMTLDLIEKTELMLLNNS